MDAKRKTQIDEKIKVFCRMRPPNDEIRINPELSVISIVPNDICCYKATKTNYSFKFDTIFDKSSMQDEIYDVIAKPIVQSTIEGYSGTIFAYGPTGSGKTHTMRGQGSGSFRGIMPRCIEQLLASSNKTELWISYLQIYCEDVEDLLVQPQLTSKIEDGSNMLPSSTFPPNISSFSLNIREKSGNVFVEGLSRIRIQSVDDFWEVLQRGDLRRSTAATLANQTSSRSHAVMIVTILTPDTTSSVEVNKENSADKLGNAASSTTGALSNQLMKRESNLVLVDLAGSERAAASDGRPMRLEEAKAINLSLSSLGNCINALAEGKPHVPFRDSKLTRLLQGSLGGGSRTAVILTLPYANDTVSGDLLSALRFASRASQVQVQAKVSRCVDYEALYSELQKRFDDNESKEREAERTIAQLIAQKEQKESIIENLREELQRLKSQLQQVQANNNNNKIEVTESETKDASQSLLLQPLLKDTNNNNNSNRINQEINSLKALYEKKISALKKSLNEANQETTLLEIELQSERQKHLLTAQSLTTCRFQLRDVESRRDERVQELLMELSERRLHEEELLQEIDMTRKFAEDSNAKMSMQLIEARREMEGSVSRSQVLEMERLFSETVNKLADRVQQLEGKSHNYRQPSHSQPQPAIRNEWSDEDENDEDGDDNNQLEESIFRPPDKQSGVRFAPGRLRPLPAGITGTAKEDALMGRPRNLGVGGKIRGRY